MNPLLKTEFYKIYKYFRLSIILFAIILCFPIYLIFWFILLILALPIILFYLIQSVIMDDFYFTADIFRFWFWFPKNIEDREYIGDGNSISPINLFMQIYNFIKDVKEGKK